MSDSKGLGITMVAVGGLFMFAGIRGLSVTGAISDIVQGKNPKTALANQWQAAASSSTTATPAAGATPSSGPVGAGQSAFIAAVLSGLGAPNTAANQASLADWFRHEGTAAQNNPMATTQREPGSTNFNTQGPVQNYPTAELGVQATVTTLNNGLYPAIVAALRDGGGLSNRGGAVASELLTWSGGGYSSV